MTLNERSFRITIVVCYSLPRIRFPIGGQSIVTIALLHTWSIAIQHNLTDCNLRWDKKEKLVTVLAADTCSSAVSSCQGRLFDEVWQQCCGYVQLSNDPSSRRLHNKVHPRHQSHRTPVKPVTATARLPNTPPPKRHVKCPSSTIL